jgi:glycosyltransferase involved in cell wall biosynthesis
LAKRTLGVFKLFMKKTINKFNNNLSILVVTSSFPNRQNPVSGIFIKRLVDNIPAPIKVSVLTPCGSEPNDFSPDSNYQIKCFRYAPWKWQKLAHLPGGIPAALDQSFCMKLLLPIFLISMFLCCVREIPKADIIHANWSVNGFICALANMLVRRPLILTLRGTDITKSASSKFYNFLLRFAMRFSDVVTVVSEAMCQQLVSQHPEYHQKIILVPNGVENELLQLPVRQIKHDQDYFQVLVIANLIKLKNVPVVIRAISKLKNELKMKLTVIGDGPEKIDLEKLSRELGVAEHVKFAGLVDPKDIASYLQQANCLVLTSLSEGKPNVVLEAFASGLPVIASNIDGVKEMIGNNENGLLYDSGNDEMLAAKLLDLFRNDSLFKTYSENGRKYILQNKLLWGDTGDRYASIYNSLVEVS